MPSRRPFLALSVIITVMLAMTVIAHRLWLRNATVVEENHLVEWTQVVFLLIAAGVHTWKARHRTAGADHLVRLVLAMLCVSFAVREVDIDAFSPAAVMPTVQTVIRLVVAAAWLVLSWRVLRVFDALWRRRYAIAFSAVSVFTLAGCALYIASWPFDKYPDSLGGDTTAMFIEETIQLNATFLMLVASWCTLPRDTPTCRTA